MFQRPSEKTGIALIIKGIQGAGKNRLLDLIKLLMGVSKYLETSRPEHDIYGRFTDARRDKILVVINEAGRRANVGNADQLKDMITSSTFTWEAKGRDIIKMNCFCRFIFTTNNDNIIKMDLAER
jgi:phage/plasmid-associated DNA primase